MAMIFYSIARRSTLSWGMARGMARELCAIPSPGMARGMARAPCAIPWVACCLGDVGLLPEYVWHGAVGWLCCGQSGWNVDGLGSLRLPINALLGSLRLPINALLGSLGDGHGAGSLLGEISPSWFGGLVRVWRGYG